MSILNSRLFDFARKTSVFVLLLVLCLPLLPQASQLSEPTDDAGQSIAGSQDKYPGFTLWSAAELERRNVRLGASIREDGSSRETLADYEIPDRSRRFRFIRRDRDGLPEQHDSIEDYVYIQSGQGAILVGGQMLGRNGDLGTEIIGGTRYAVGAGDVLRIPAGVPHAYLVDGAGHITYVLVRLPAFRGQAIAVPDGQAPEMEPPGFGLWRAAELQRRNTALGTRIRTDGSARETLADYGAGGSSHRLRFLRRDLKGPPELHEDIIDVVFIQSGRGAVLVGGELIGESNVPGSSISGGTQFPVAAGDVLHIPAQMPHAYLAAQGDHLTYVLLRMPALSD
ncbi:MAG: hypothetical protein R3F41_10105 [Gammaproteobacteria bacterium]|nr:hypothetical protein [Pseudomonadales bacterium]